MCHCVRMRDIRLCHSRLDCTPVLQYAKKNRLIRKFQIPSKAILLSIFYSSARGLTRFIVPHNRICGYIMNNQPRIDACLSVNIRNAIVSDLPCVISIIRSLTNPFFNHTGVVLLLIVVDSHQQQIPSVIRKGFPVFRLNGYSRR